MSLTRVGAVLFVSFLYFLLFFRLSGMLGGVRRWNQSLDVAAQGVEAGTEHGDENQGQDP